MKEKFDIKISIFTNPTFLQIRIRNRQRHKDPDRNPGTKGKIELEGNGTPSPCLLTITSIVGISHGQAKVTSNLTQAVQPKVIAFVGV